VAAPRAPTLDPNRIAILPFRVTGADTALAEGMAELLAVEFTGEGGPQAVDPGTLWRAWRRAGGGPRQPLTQEGALRLARDLGAGQLLTGSVVGIGPRVTLNASVFEVPGGVVRLRATPVSGPADSLPALLRALATGLLAGVGADRDVVTTSPEALREYLVGVAHYRRGGWGEANRHLDRALTLDSNFVAAAMVLWWSAGWARSPLGDRARRLAWVHRDRLSARDRLWLEAVLGPRWPAAVSGPEVLALQERLVEQAPDNPEAWALLGDTYFHWGRTLGYVDGRARAAIAFGRALVLDSTHGPSLQHLLELAAEREDSAAARAYFVRLVAAGGGDPGTAMRWSRMFAVRDGPAIEQELDGPDAATGAPAYFTALAWDAFGMRYAARVLESLERASPTERSRAQTREFRIALELNRGRPRAARAARLEGPGGGPTLSRSIWPGGVAGHDVVAALFAGGDSALGAATVELAEPLATAPLADDPDARRQQYRASCVAGLWRGWHGDFDAVQRAMERLGLAATPRDAFVDVVTATLCRATLDALLAVRTRRPDAAATLARLDSLGRWDARPGFAVHWEYLVLARLLAERGELARALEVVSRRDYNGMLPLPTFLTASLREECRLAALLAERDIGLKACRWYLALVTDPEPALIPQRDSVRAELARLEGK
jgi:tetratricopeptide (TPR) repeat protein